jgi:hypothetical protein
MRKCYVYELKDPRDDKVFYAGKGKGNRIDHHEVEALKGVSSDKRNKIRDVLDSNNKIVKQKVAFFSCEKEAYIFEDKPILKYGLNNLTNKVYGWWSLGKKAEKKDPWEFIESNPLMFKHWWDITGGWKFKVELNEDKESGIIGVIQKMYLLCYNVWIPEMLSKIPKGTTVRIYHNGGA